jgi:hypothetical protein
VVSDVGTRKNSGDPIKINSNKELLKGLGVVPEFLKR